MIKNKRAFTLIELIFTIVIIGVLAAVAIPKYNNLKDNALIAKLQKISFDAMSAIPAAFINEVDLGGKALTEVKLDELYSIKGETFSVSSGTGWTYNEYGSSGQHYRYSYKYNVIINISLYPDNRSMQITAYCNNFGTLGNLKEICKKSLPDTQGFEYMYYYSSF